jgi:hypothetical protein
MKAKLLTLLTILGLNISYADAAYIKVNGDEIDIISDTHPFPTATSDTLAPEGTYSPNMDLDDLIGTSDVNPTQFGFLSAYIVKATAGDDGITLRISGDVSSSAKDDFSVREFLKRIKTNPHLLPGVANIEIALESTNAVLDELAAAAQGAINNYKLAQDTRSIGSTTTSAAGLSSGVPITDVSSLDTTTSAASPSSGAPTTDVSDDPSSS